MNDALVTLNQFGESFVDHAGWMFVQAGMLILVKLILPPSFSLPMGVGNWVGRIAGFRSARVENADRVAGVSPARVEGVSPSLNNQPALYRAQSLPRTSRGEGRNAEDVPVRIAWPGVLLAALVQFPRHATLERLEAARQAQAGQRPGKVK